jgi:hypothetical protein
MTKSNKIDDIGLDVTRDVVIELGDWIFVKILLEELVFVCLFLVFCLLGVVFFSPNYLFD